MTKTVTLLSYDYPPNDGGISRLTAAFATELATKGVDLEVCTLKATTTKQGSARPDLPTIELLRPKGLRELGLIRYVLSQPKQSRFITTVWNPEATITWLLGRKNIYILAHGNEVMPYPKGPKYLLKSWLRKKVLTSARCVVCNSQYTEQLVANISPNIKTEVISPGVDLENFATNITQAEARQTLGLPSDKSIVLSVSRIDDYKGHDVILDALASLSKEQLEHIHYVVAGKGRHLENLKHRAKELQINDYINWFGFVSDEDLPALYKAADLFILCTREDKQQRGVEGFGMVFLEAQAAGLAVVGTRAGGIPDAIKSNEGGWLIDQNDSQAVATYLKKLVNNPQEFYEQGKLGYERVQNHCTWQHYTRALLTILEKY